MKYNVNMFNIFLFTLSKDIRNLFINKKFLLNTYIPSSKIKYITLLHSNIGNKFSNCL